MENDIKNENDENLIDIKDYFLLDFAEQTIKGNRKFEMFKKKKLDELGKDAKLFHCKNDNIYFYVSKKEWESRNYNIICPKCKNYVCYFCERISNYINLVPANSCYCCALSGLNYLFFINGFKYCKDYSHLNDEKKWFFILFLILDLIPLTKCFWYSIEFFVYLLHNLYLKNKKWKIKVYHDTDYGNYQNQKSAFIYMVVAIILMVNSLAFAICYAIIALYINILILIVSFFTKFYPLKYSVGIFHWFM